MNYKDVFTNDPIEKINICGKTYKLPKKIILTEKEKKFCYENDRSVIISLIILKLLCEEEK